ncbi:MAG TPA: hypothetical protein PKB15_02195 [Acidimicrobiia bacterium]|nr:hypothetical protein [Acidimicrobiia bacterium]
MSKKNIMTLVAVLAILLIAGLSYTLFAGNDSKESKPKNTASVHLVLDHALNETVSIKITIDNKVILNDSVKPVEQMPPIAFSQELDLSKGSHVIIFEDKTRNIREEQPFSVPNTKSILIKTQKIDTHIALSTEPIGIK